MAEPVQERSFEIPSHGRGHLLGSRQARAEKDVRHLLSVCTIAREGKEIPIDFRQRDLLVAQDALPDS
jgi:hypothetical protein